jgi:hypothetical protein
VQHAWASFAHVLAVTSRLRWRVADRIRAELEGFVKDVWEGDGLPLPTQKSAYSLTTRSAGSVGPLRGGGRTPPLQVPAHDFDGARNRERDSECEQEALPGRRLERVAAEVPE